MQIAQYGSARCASAAMNASFTVAFEQVVRAERAAWQTRHDPMRGPVIVP